MNLLRIEDLPASSYTILQQAEGNPFYVEEVIRSLMDSGAIARDETTGHWRATRDVADIAVPDTLQGVIRPASTGCRKTPGACCRWRRSSVPAFLSGAGGHGGGRALPRGKLVTLQREEMIRERTRIPELEYIFKHFLTREAAYEGILKRDRKAYHRRVAEAMERLFPDRSDEMLGLLAYHWERAEDPIGQ